MAQERARYDCKSIVKVFSEFCECLPYYTNIPLSWKEKLVNIQSLFEKSLESDERKPKHIQVEVANRKSSLITWKILAIQIRLLMILIRICWRIAAESLTIRPTEIVFLRCHFTRRFGFDQIQVEDHGDRELFRKLSERILSCHSILQKTGSGIGVLLSPGQIMESTPRKPPSLNF